tara:strand:- start:3333 stop:6203 length:2871 start_codon:yes stop_codon:yes gene_type:complete
MLWRGGGGRLPLLSSFEKTTTTTTTTTASSKRNRRRNNNKSALCCVRSNDALLFFTELHHAHWKGPTPPLATVGAPTTSRRRRRRRRRRKALTRANATKKDDDDVTDITCDAKKNEEERDPEEEAYEEIEEEVEVEYTTMDHISDFMNEVKEKRMEISRNCFSVVGEMTPTPEYLKSSRARGDATAELASLAVAAAAVVASKTARMNKEKKERCVKDETWTVEKAFEALKIIDGQENDSSVKMRLYDETDFQRDQEKKQKKLDEKRVKELERRKLRDEKERLREEAEEKERQRLLEIERKKEEEEERKREQIRAEFRLKQAEEQERLKKREEEEAARKKKELEEDRKRREEKMRLEREALEAERLRRKKISEERKEKTFSIQANIKVEAKRKNGKCEVTASCRVEFSSTSEVNETHESTEMARLQMSWASKLSGEAMKAYKSDQILKKMMGEGILSKTPTFSDVEFEHWMKLVRVRLDRELRTTGLRAVAGLEANKLTKNDNFIEREVTFSRALLPREDPENVETRMQNAIRLLIDQVEQKSKNKKKSGSDKAAADDDDDDDDDDPYLLGDTNSSSVVDEAIDPRKSPMVILTRLSEHELAQMHGLDPSLVFPAETDGLTTELNGRVLSGILTASFFVKVLRDVTKDAKPEVLRRGTEMASSLVGRCANDEGNWRAMYLDGFRGDALEAGALMAREVIPDEENDIVLLNIFAALEAMEKAKNRRPEEQASEMIDQETLRRMKAQRRMNSVPITERLFATRNAAIQLAGSGSVEQGRAMLEEAYALRVNHVEKRRKELGLTSNDERFGIPETLPELKALLFVIDYGGSAWEADKRGLQKEILKAVYEACENGAMKKDAEKALATFAAVRRSFMFEENDAEFGREWEEKLMEKIMDAGGLRAVEETDGNEDEGEGKPSANLDVDVEEVIKKYYPRGVSDALEYAVQTYDAEIEARRKV